MLGRLVVAQIAPIRSIIKVASILISFTPLSVLESFNVTLSTSKAINLLFGVSFLFPLPVARLNAIDESGYAKAAGRSIALSLLLKNADSDPRIFLLTSTVV